MLFVYVWFYTFILLLNVNSVLQCLYYLSVLIIIIIIILFVIVSHLSFLLQLDLLSKTSKNQIEYFFSLSLSNYIHF